MQRRQYRLLQHQTGATLVTALIVVLLVTALATRMGSDYLLLFRSVEQQTRLQQGRNWLRGAEELASYALLQDLLYDSGVDTYLEPWATTMQIPLPEGILAACLHDLQARINLNDLGAPAGSYSPAQLRFIRLLQVLPLDAALTTRDALALAHAVFDWVDSDNAVRFPGGAEALDYQRMTPPYRPANQAFHSVDELRLVAGMTDELFRALTPHVSVWGNGRINFNTLDRALAWSAADDSEEAQPVLLRTLNNPESLQPLSVEAARRLAAVRSNSGGYVQDLALFTRGEFAMQQWDLAGVDVRSEYFLLEAAMQQAGNAAPLRLTSVMRRSIDATGIPNVEVLNRHFSVSQSNEESSCADPLL
jgi:general secretion pathway protein K